ncbi:MAG: hypothetical protein ABEI52_01930 [Halobacteriaceae archaeon]
MSQEIKVRIHELDEIDSRLLELGATFDREVEVKDTYFEGQGEDVLKIRNT